MNRNELIQAQQHFISTFQTLTREDKLEFLNFNRYHHKRPIQDVISIFVQYPEARYLGSFDFWKDYSTESSVQFGQKVAVRLYDKQGRLSEQLFDIAQTTLHTVPDIRDTVLSDRLLTNSLAELTGNDYFIGEEHYGQYFESISDSIEQYIKEHVPAASLENYSPKQQKLALTLAKYNICEEFGAFLEDSERYEAFLDNIATSIDELGSEDNLLRTFALGNNYSKELSTQVYSLYEEVDKKTEHLVQEQTSLNNKIASLDSDLSFDKPDVFDVQNESSDTNVEDNLTEETEILPAEEKPVSDTLYNTTVPTLNFKINDGLGALFIQLYSSDQEQRGAAQISPALLITDNINSISDEEKIQNAKRREEIISIVQKSPDMALEFIKEVNGRISWKKDGTNIYDILPSIDYTNLSWESISQGLEEVSPQYHNLVHEPNHIQEKQQQTTEGIDEPLASDKAFLEAVIEHFELPDNFIVTQDEYSTDLVKGNFWGTEKVLSMDGELEVSGAASVITEIKDFEKKVLQYYSDYTNQEFQYRVGDILFLEGQYMASGYDEELIKISSLPEDSSQPMSTEQVVRRIVDNREPTDYNYHPQLKLYRYQTVKARLATDEEIEIFNATKDKATTKEVSLFDAEEEISKPSTETIDLDALSPEEVEQAREKEIKEDLLRGSGFQEGKFRIYYFFKNNGSSKDRIPFLKDEYGVGGHSAFGENKYTQMHDAKGLRFYSDNDDVLLPWKNIAERLDLLIASNEYLTDKELEEFQVWKADKEAVIQSKSDNLSSLSDEELEQELQKSYKEMLGENGNSFISSAFDRWTSVTNEKISRKPKEISLFDDINETPVPNQNISSEAQIEENKEEVIEQSLVETIQDKVNFTFPEEDFYPKTPREKVEANIEAIQLVKKLDEENRLATPFEQQVLARYVGWGGIANKFFDESNPVFEEQRNTLKKMVSLAEYSAMRESSLTAYYTDPQLIQKMYASLENLGFTGGKILDPSMGTGNFFSALPEALQDNSELYGVELDKITGQIAKQLHQATNIQVTGFEHTKFVDNALDLVITNVPFGQIPIVDKRYEKNHVIHDYFIKRSLDLVHEGGFVAVITSTATMDKRDDRVRSELARQANLVTAARLPKNAFTAIAGTDVSSDILIFQKTSTPDPSPEWLETTSLSDERGNTVHYNKYFENHPDHILGHIKIEAFNGGTLSITPEFSLDDLPMELGNVLSDIQVEIKPFEKKDKTLQVLEEIKLPGQTEDFNIEPYTIEVIEGVPYYHNGEEVVRHQKTSSITLNANETRQNQLKRFEKVKDRIFDKKTSYKNIFSSSGYFDSWSNFIFTPAKANTPKIPHEVLEMLNDGYDQTIHEDHRYTVSKGKDNLLTLTVEEAVSTKYSYTQDYNSRDVKAMQGMIDLRHSLQDVLNIQRIHDISEPEYKVEYETLLRRLNDKYDTFVKKYGAVSRPENATLLRRDDYYPFLTSIEQEKENSITHEKEYSKAPVFFEPTIQPLPQSVVVSSAGDALLASLNHKGKLDFEYMTDVYEGHTREDIIQELGNQIFYEGNGQYATREEYLSGDVKTKLSLAKTNNDFEVEGYDWSVNIQALEEVIPLDLPLSDINYRLGARFIPIPVYQRFLAEQFEQKGYYDDDYNADWITIEYDERGDSYKVSARMEGTYGLRDKFGLASKNYPGDKLATELLNLRDPKIYKPDPNDPTGKKRVLDEVATEAIQDKGKMLTSAFKDWVLKTPDVQMEIVQIYNEKFNRYVGRTYDGSQLTVNGLAKQFKLRPHQANAVMRAVIEGRAGLAHEVGAGKTLTLLASARKMKELGIAQKPLFVIPKPLVEQFGREIYQYFPESHVLIAQSEDFQKENRKRFVSRILTGKYDFIVIADSQFGKIAMSKEYQEHYILTQLEAERSAMENMDDKSFTVKKIEQRIKRMEKSLEDLQKKDTDSFINFEELGIDLLVVDEAHNFKNLAPMTQLENVKGISDTRSQKAMDLQQKIEYLQNQYNYRRVIFSTGTPLSNSVVEMYTMMRYTEPDVLARYGVLNFDTWVSTFGMIENNFELTAAGTFKINRRFVKFGNMQELMNMFKETWDIQTSNMLDLPVPEAEIITHKSPITEAQKLYTNDLIQRASNIERGFVKPWEDNMLRIVGENKKLSLDMRTLDDKYYTAEDSNKLQQVVNTVFDIYKKYDEQKGTQIIFSDMSVPLKYRNSQAKNTDETINSFSAYDEIKAALVKKGIPEQEVRFIHEATDKTKAVMMQEMREGKIRILLGSTGKAGTGLNVQDKLIAVHHLDVPWRPSDVIQRNGRIIRQGNENEKVQIHYYITPGTMDSFLWQTQENKIKFTEQVMEGTSTSREMEEMETAIPTASQLKAAANGNPLQAEFMQIEMELQGLERSRNRFYEEQARSQERVLKDQEKLPQAEKLYEKQQLDVQNAKDTQDKPFELTLHFNDQSRIFTEEDKKADVGLALVGRINTSLAENNLQANKIMQHIATYRGFEIYHNPSASVTGQTTMEEHLFMKGHAQYSCMVSLESPTGILTRLNNRIDEGIEKSAAATLKDISRLQSAIAQTEEDKAKRFPDEDVYHTKKERHNELKELLKQQKSDEISATQIVNEGSEMEI
ncbi:SNF2-related protein [Lactococcus garvieae]|uniref:SNF2-related protein n=1 Tax=Lactococcus garvieae TaxID=1363 RepID=UPI00254A2BC0|nr:SNF2-related protein [Lactococcus garvieae]